MTKFENTGDEGHIFELRDLAVNAFIQAQKKEKRVGEAGELILFVLLEAFIGAPMIASKMCLKTARDIEVHGSDGIHAYYDSQKGKLVLFLGESKMDNELSDAFASMETSLQDYYKLKDGESGKERDINVIKNHIDIPNEEIKNAILDYFDYTTPQSNEIEEVHACLAAWSYYRYSRIPTGVTDAEVKEYFEEKYLERIKTACDLFSEKIESNDHLKTLQYSLFLFFRF